MIIAGIGLFSLSVLFTVVTLPVEFDASRRALKCIRDTNLLYGEEYQGAKKVLQAAAMTYVAAAATAILQLLRLIFIANRRN
jgi:Zn-dependent membrane protease YugP